MFVTWLSNFQSHVTTFDTAEKLKSSVVQQHEAYAKHIRMSAAILDKLRIAWCGTILLVVGLQEVKEQVKSDTNFLDLTLELAGLRACLITKTQEECVRELQITEALHCKYNRVLSQVVEKALLAGIIVVLGEVMPLGFHGDATSNGHRSVHCVAIICPAFVSYDNF